MTAPRADVKRLVRCGAGLILALLLGDALSPSTLVASCGDHVRFSSATTTDSEPASGPLLPTAPCTGECSQHEAPPLASVIPPSGDNDTGCLPAPLNDPPLRPVLRARHGDILPWPGVAPRIFHPPRP
jgi:hypothetical protein